MKFEPNGPASQWIRLNSKLYKAEEAQAPEWLRTWPAFSRMMNTRFGESENAETRIMKLKLMEHAVLHNSETTREYASKFLTLAEKGTCLGRLGRQCSGSARGPKSERPSSDVSLKIFQALSVQPSPLTTTLHWAIDLHSPQDWHWTLGPRPPSSARQTSGSTTIRRLSAGPLRRWRSTQPSASADEREVNKLPSHNDSPSLLLLGHLL